MISIRDTIRHIARAWAYFDNPTTTLERARAAWPEITHGLLIEHARGVAINPTDLADWLFRKGIYEERPRE